MKSTRKTTVSVPKDRFHHTGKIWVLASAECKGFFPADVIFMGDVVRLRYCTENFRPLSQCGPMKTEETLRTVKAVLRLQIAVQDWMWFSDEYVLSPDTVWKNSREQFRILCVPDKRRISGQQRLLLFLHDMKKLSEPAASSCLQILQEIVESGTVETAMLLSEIDLLMAEVQSYL